MGRLNKTKQRTCKRCHTSLSYQNTVKVQDIEQVRDPTCSGSKSKSIWYMNLFKKCYKDYQMMKLSFLKNY